MLVEQEEDFHASGGFTALPAFPSWSAPGLRCKTRTLRVTKEGISAAVVSAGGESRPGGREPPR